jgi:hypothetical protein
MVWLATKKMTCAKAALPRHAPSPQGPVFVTLIGMCLMGISWVCVSWAYTGVHLKGVHPMGVYLIDVH